MLFQTNFDTLDALKGRNQTTRGIHLAYSLSCKSLVVDIEGTDSQIRGDDGAAFEQMSALFALAISDVLMVNMWTSEIGRYKAASVGLLKTIFEVNLKLFGQEGKKRILFVLRDFNDASNNLTILKQQISKTMEEIWDKIKKPSHLSLCNVFDCFEFDFHTVAVKDFKPEEFIRDVNTLREKFMDSSRNDYLFRNKLTDVPIDGIPRYLSEIWTLIHSDKDLNIPSQKEMLANLRCNELKLEAIKEFQNKVQAIGKQVGRSLVSELGLKFAALYDETLAIYDEHASGYYENTYKTIRGELIALLLDQSKEMFNAQMKFIVNSSIMRSKELFAASLSRSQAVENFGEIVYKILCTIRNDFQAEANGSVVPSSSWEYSEFELELEGFLAEKINDEKEKQFALLNKEIDTVFGGKFTSEIGKVLDSAMEGNVWHKLKDLQRNIMRPAEMRSIQIFRSLERPEEEANVFVNSIRLRCIGVIRMKLDKFIKSLEEYMTKKFNALFNKDEKGVPRDPKTTNYEEVFSSSKAKVLPALDQFKYFALSPDWERTEDDTHEELLGDDEYEKILESFLKDAERTYKDALHIKEFGYNRGGLPKWSMLLMVLLGWNEVLWILRSPIILYPAIFVGSIVALMFSMGLGAVPKLIFGQIINKVPFLL